MQVVSRHGAALVVLIALAGCAGRSAPYAVNGTPYATAQQALDAGWQISNGYIQALQPQAAPLPGKARIVIPDRDRLRPLVAQGIVRFFIGEALDFRIDLERQELLLDVAALKQGKAFATIVTAEQNDTIAPDIGDADFLIWFQVRSETPANGGPFVGTWLIRRAGDERSASFGMDPGAGSGTPRYASFVKGVRDAVARLGGVGFDTTTGRG